MTFQHTLQVFHLYQVKKIVLNPDLHGTRSQSKHDHGKNWNCKHKKVFTFDNAIASYCWNMRVIFIIINLSSFIPSEH